MPVRHLIGAAAAALVAAAGWATPVASPARGKVALLRSEPPEPLKDRINVVLTGYGPFGPKPAKRCASVAVDPIPVIAAALRESLGPKATVTVARAPRRPLRRPTAVVAVKLFHNVISLESGARIDDGVISPSTDYWMEDIVSAVVGVGVYDGRRLRSGTGFEMDLIGARTAHQSGPFEPCREEALAAEADQVVGRKLAEHVRWALGGAEPSTPGGHSPVRISPDPAL